MANWLVGPILDKLIKVGLEYLQYQPRMKDMLERLRDNYPKIQAILSVARRPQAEMLDQDMALNKWIWQIRDAIDEADDFFDELEYFNLKEQLGRNKEENKVRSFSNIISNPAKRLCVGDEDRPDLKKLEELVQKLDNIFAGASTLFHLLEIKQEQRDQQDELHKTRETGSLPKNDLIGRGENKEFVIGWLRQPSDVTTTALYRNISLLSIVGHGGMGKTTLLQHIYQDEMTKEFELKMWVCVSDSFDAKKVIADMLECLQKKRPSLESLDALQERLKSKVMSKKFLLVLDDLWDKEEEEAVLCGKCENVFAPLASGGLGSKILITTRTDAVASMIAKVIRKKKESLRLEGLKEDECLQLLTTHAFEDIENQDDHKNLISIAGELVKKLYGSPLAAKVMGGILNSTLDESHWRNVLNNSLGHKSIFSILKLSYIFLPEYLQSCFSFCSIFAQDHLFDKDDVVRMWIAVGFIEPSHNNQGETFTLEDIGGRYFDILIKKSFFEKVFFAETYKIHDLLQELAQYVSKQECFKFVGDEKSQILEIPETTRHLSFQTDNFELLKEIGRFKNLRSLFISFHSQSFADALDEIFKVTKSIRLLRIIDNRLKVIPENIGYLHHLRYLRFYGYFVELLPRSISSLYHLQFLTIKDRVWNRFFYNDYFPRDMNNLFNLRYLGVQGLNFPGIGKLKLLKELEEFNIKNENGYRVEELEDMNELRILELNNLTEVRNAEAACKAKLCDKGKLTFLNLKWGIRFESDIADLDLYERVLDKLQPHNNLKKLWIFKYMGTRSAIWMNEVHLFNNLEEIYLCDCWKWEILPPFGLLPFLKTLRLFRLPKVKRLENKFHGNDMCRGVFPSLKMLSFEYLEALVDWFDASVDGLFPCLTTLYLNRCPNLQQLPYLPPKLESLEIDNIPWKTLNCCSISNSIPLKISSLSVLNCPNITSISLAGDISKLKSLRIEKCPFLNSLREEHQEVESTKSCQLILNHLTLSDPSMLQIEPLRSCTSTNSMTISGNFELVSFSIEAEQWFGQVSSSLRELTFENLLSLQSLPFSLTNISSLEFLDVICLPFLREMPDLPPSLKGLKIHNCDSELMKRYEQFPNSREDFSRSYSSQYYFDLVLSSSFTPPTPPTSPSHPP